MQLPHALLIPLALGLSWAGHLLCWSHENLRPAAAPPALGVAGSPYGSLVARVMRDSLFSYWHGGQTVEAHEEEHRHGAHGDDDDGDEHHHEKEDGHTAEKAAVQRLSWLDQAGRQIHELEAARTKRNSPFAMTPAHKRYLDAASTMRLRFAYHLDPGDATLYEILHFQLAAHPEAPVQSLVTTMALAQAAIDHALSSHGSLSDALTGAGAAVNLLNDQLRPGQHHRASSAVILSHWKVLNLCLQRYREARQQAESEGWWEDIPASRREELNTQAHLLEKIASTIHQQLLNEKYLSS